MTEWEEVEADVVVAYEHPDDMEIWVEEVVDGDSGELVVRLFRTVRADGFEADIETFTAGANSIDNATDLVTELINDVDRNTVTALRANRVEVGDEPVVHFYCLFEETLPEWCDPSMVTFDEDGVELPPRDERDEDGESIRIDVYPLFETDVREVNDD